MISHEDAVDNFLHDILATRRGGKGSCTKDNFWSQLRHLKGAPGPLPFFTSATHSSPFSQTLFGYSGKRTDK